MFDRKKILEILDDLDKVFNKHKMTAADAVIVANLFRDTVTFKSQCGTMQDATRETLNKVLGGEKNASLKYVH